MSNSRLTGLVTNVQRFSIHDGPGIRTTVFLKGCALRCFWCHNPEALSPAPEVQWFPDRCIGCDACIEACPRRAQVRVDGQRGYLRDRCQGCGRCTAVCDAEALAMSGRTWAADQLVDLLLRDRQFYERSGGGITLSGGEPALQPGFSRAVLEQCQWAGLRTAIETAAHCPWGHLAGMLPALDLVILDLKTIDSRAHEAATGARNRRILANARRLGESSVPVMVRTPVVPGFNDIPEAIAGVAAFIRGFPNLLRYELMPFHAMGKAKYAGLDLPYKAEHMLPPTAETLERLAAAARAAGLANVKIG